MASKKDNVGKVFSAEVLSFFQGDSDLNQNSSEDSKYASEEDSDSSGEESMNKRPKIGDNLAALTSSSYYKGETTLEEDHMEEILSEHESESTR